MSAPPEPWDDSAADLVALVREARRPSGTPGQQQALEVLARFADRDGVLAAALKLLAELCEDLDLCEACFSRYAARAIAR